MSDFLNIGEIFDEKYKIEQILGSGGNGTAYRAKQLDCNRTIALKVLHCQNGRGDAHEEARFLREARALSALTHENIVTVYHLGISPQNMPYLAMELVDGESLRTIINKTDRMPVLRSLRIIRDAAKALSVAHKVGIVHRDLKPENILITQSPNPDTVKLIDFGLAKITEAPAIGPVATFDQQKLTNTGQLLGSVKYMSPEQCAGKVVDFKSDIYSLTCCLYEMITGEAPFDADSPVGIIYKHVNAAPPEIVFSAVELYHPRLAELISQGLSKQPGKRFASMDEMSLQIEDLIHTFEQNGALKSPPKRHVRWIELLTAGILLLFIPIIALQLTMNPGSTDLRNLSKSAVLPQSYEIKGRYSEKKNTEYWHAKRQLDSVEKMYGTNDFRVAKALERLMQISKQQNKFSESELYAKRALSIRKKAPIENTLSIISTLRDLGGCYTEESKFSEAEKCFNEALDTLEKSKGIDHKAFITTWQVLAECLMKQGKTLEARTALLKALSTYKERGINKPHTKLDILIGLINCTSGDECRSYLSQANKMTETSDPNTPSFLSRLRIALANERLGDQKNAERILTNSLHIKQLNYGKTDIESAYGNRDIGEYYERQHRDSDAATYLTEAMQIFQAQNHPDLPSCLVRLTNCLKRLGKNKEAEQLLQNSTHD